MKLTKRGERVRDILALVLIVGAWLFAAWLEHL